MGDAVESVLKSVGITEERVEKWLGKKCGCKQRKERLNLLSQWATQWLGRTTSNTAPEAARQLEGLMENGGEGKPK